MKFSSSLSFLCKEESLSAFTTAWGTLDSCPCQRSASYPKFAKKGVVLVVLLREVLYASCAADSSSTQSSCSKLMKALKYASTTWFIRSVWPSVWGLNAVDSLLLTPMLFISACQNLEANRVSRSVMISSGHQW